MPKKKIDLKKITYNEWQKIQSIFCPLIESSGLSNEIQQMLKDFYKYFTKFKNKKKKIELNLIYSIYSYCKKILNSYNTLQINTYFQKYYEQAKNVKLINNANKNDKLAIIIIYVNYSISFFINMLNYKINNDKEDKIK